MSRALRPLLLVVCLQSSCEFTASTAPAQDRAAAGLCDGGDQTDDKRENPDGLTVHQLLDLSSKGTRITSPEGDLARASPTISQIRDLRPKVMTRRPLRDRSQQVRMSADLYQDDRVLRLEVADAQACVKKSSEETWYFGTLSDDVWASRPPKSTLPIAAILKAETTTYFVGEPIYVQFKLKNVGTKPVRIDAPYHLQWRDSRSNIDVEVEKDGRRVKTFFGRGFGGGISISLPPPITLKPGTSTEWERLIVMTPEPRRIERRGRDQSEAKPGEPGQYVVRARYAVASGSLSMFDDARSEYEVLSNPVYLTIMGPGIRK